MASGRLNLSGQQLKSLPAELWEPQTLLTQVDLSFDAQRDQSWWEVKTFMLEY